LLSCLLLGSNQKRGKKNEASQRAKGAP
jgi:hypothetical protein